MDGGGWLGVIETKRSQAIDVEAVGQSMRREASAVLAHMRLAVIRSRADADDGARGCGRRAEDASEAAHCYSAKRAPTHLKTELRFKTASTAGAIRNLQTHSIF